MVKLLERRFPIRTPTARGLGMATTYKGAMANLSLTKLEIVVAQLVWSGSVK
jgi:hypothetical protein